MFPTSGATNASAPAGAKAAPKGSLGPAGLRWPVGSATEAIRQLLTVSGWGRDDSNDAVAHPMADATVWPSGSASAGGCATSRPSFAPSRVDQAYPVDS